MVIWRNVIEYKTEGSSLNLNKDRLCRRRTERTQENIILLQENIIEDPRTSARKNGLDISKSTFNPINKYDLKWHTYKMHAKKETKNYRGDLLKENQDLRT